VALFPEDLWPKAIGVNGLMNIEGKKISKSEGNIISIQEAVENYGADTIRLFLALAAEGLDDVEWTSSGLKQTINTLNSFYSFIMRLINMNILSNKTNMDKWLISIFQKKDKNKYTVIFLKSLKIRKCNKCSFILKFGQT